MGQYNLVLRNQLYDTVCRPWEGDNTSLQAELIRTVAHWSEIASAEETPPVHYTSAEVEERLGRDANQKKADEQMQQVRDFIGINIEGWVQNEGFERAREKARLIRNEMVEGIGTEERRELAISGPRGNGLADHINNFKERSDLPKKWPTRKSMTLISTRNSSTPFIHDSKEYPAGLRVYWRGHYLPLAG